MVATGIMVIETVPEQASNETTFNILETICVFLFTLELALKLVSANKREIRMSWDGVGLGSGERWGQ